MMLETVLSFGGSATPQIGVDWFGEPFRPIKRLPGQLMGLGMTSEEARRILSVGTYGGTYTQAQVDEAQRVYYGTATTPGAYQQAVAAQPSASTGDCGAFPVRPKYTVMSTPTCGPMDNACQVLAGQIAGYNASLAAASLAKYQHDVCVHNACRNGQGASGCDSQYPPVNIQAKPIYPDARAILVDNTYVMGYSDQPIGTIGPTGLVVGQITSPTSGSGGAGAGSGAAGDEVPAARKIYTDLLSEYGVSANTAVTALFNKAFDDGVTWYKSTHNNSTVGLAAFVAPNARNTVIGWLKATGVMKADGTMNTTNTGSGGSGGSGGNSESGGTGDKDGDKDSGDSGSQGGMFIALGAVALLMLMGKGR